MKWYHPVIAVAGVLTVVCLGNIITDSREFSSYDIGVLVGAFAVGALLYFLVNTFNKLRIPHVPKDE